MAYLLHTDFSNWLGRVDVLIDSNRYANSFEGIDTSLFLVAWTIYFIFIILTIKLFFAITWTIVYAIEQI